MKATKKAIRKLVVRREALRALAIVDLAGIGGGAAIAPTESSPEMCELYVDLKALGGG